MQPFQHVKTKMFGYACWSDKKILLILSLVHPSKWSWKVTLSILHC